jgi:hypothetical protein
MNYFLFSGVQYLVQKDNIRHNPFINANDFVEYFYYSDNSSEIAFSIIQLNQTITATTQNTYGSGSPNVTLKIQVPKLSISTWSGKLKFVFQ